MRRFVRWLHRSQEGITGLETAIILIAFVIVASVFAYVVLSAGLFSTQKAKEAVYAGLQETRSTVEIKGDIIAKMVGGKVTEVFITVGGRPYSEPVDFTDTSNSSNLVVISYQDQYQLINTVNWTLTKLVSQNSDNLLEQNELFMITVDLSATDNIGPYHQFTLEVKPPIGAVLPIERTVPARVSQYVNLR
ncbi:MAG: archaellin/type IV pilin N-terminal domain-containing protein [Chloroflexota bacterium]